MEFNFAWMVEAPGNYYLGTRILGGRTTFFWTPDHEKGVKFCSAEQADAVMMAIRELDPAVFSFAVTLGDARPVEHGWAGKRSARAVTGAP